MEILRQGAAKNGRIRILLCLIAIGLWQAFSPGLTLAATPPDPRLDTTVYEGPAGTEIFVRAIDYLPNRVTVFQFLARTPITINATTDATGYAVATFRVENTPAGIYTILADDGTNKKTRTFKVLPTSSISQAGGSVGNPVTVKGDGFAAKKPISIYFDGNKVATSDTDDAGVFTSTKFNIPPTHTGKHSIKVQDSEGNLFNLSFTVNPVISVTPAISFVNDSITVSGSGFPAATNVVLSYDDKELVNFLSDAVGSFNSSFKVPSSAEGPHKIKISDGTNTVLGEISVQPTMTVSKDNGYVSMNVTVNGTGFKANSALNINFDKTKMIGANLDNKGEFSLSFKVPKSKSGQHTITVSDGNATKTSNFTIESTPPPQPNLVEPEEGLRFTKEDIRFRWEPVIDPSGVSYTFQLSEDARFSKIIVSESNLSRTTYDISEDQKLLISRSDPYYWRVRAVDEASNEGNWSPVGTIYKGHTAGTIINNMPVWARLSLISSGLVLFVFLVFFISKSIRKAGRMESAKDEKRRPYSKESSGWADSPFKNY